MHLRLRAAHHHAAHPRLHPEEPRQQCRARPRARHPQRTVARWKARQDVADRSTRPHRLATAITEWEEALIVELRRSLMPCRSTTSPRRCGRCVNPALSRSAIHRCLQRHGLSARLTPDKAPAVAFHTDAPGRLYPHRCQIPAAAGAPPILRLCRDRPRHPLCLSRDPGRSPRRHRRRPFAAFSRPLPASGPHRADRQGSEFTDRFAVDKRPSRTTSLPVSMPLIAFAHRITSPTA